MILVSGRSRRIWRAASTPLRLGILISIMTISGESSFASCTTCHPSWASPTTSISGCSLISALSPCRTIPWSSAITILIFLPPCFCVVSPLQRGRERYACSVSGGRLNLHAAAQVFEAFADVVEAETAFFIQKKNAGLRRDKTDAVVLCAYQNPVFALLDIHPQGGRLRIFDNVDCQLPDRPEEQHLEIGAELDVLRVRSDATFDAVLLFNLLEKPLLDGGVETEFVQGRVAQLECQRVGVCDCPVDSGTDAL